MNIYNEITNIYLAQATWLGTPVLLLMSYILLTYL